MGLMKDFLITVHNGGDEAVAAVQRMGDDWRAMLEQAAKEVEGLRLTKKERKAIAFAAKHFGAFKNQAATLLGILERNDAT